MKIDFRCSNCNSYFLSQRDTASFHITWGTWTLLQNQAQGSPPPVSCLHGYSFIRPHVTACIPVPVAVEPALLRGPQWKLGAMHRILLCLLSGKLGPVPRPLTEEPVTRTSHSCSVAQCLRVWDSIIPPVLSAFPDTIMLKMLWKISWDEPLVMLKSTEPVSPSGTKRGQSQTCNSKTGWVRFDIWIILFISWWKENGFWGHIIDQDSYKWEKKIKMSKYSKEGSS